jgi:AcrR family transcriptional regulator
VQEQSEKKGRILIAAMEIFGERPYDQVRVEEIAERAGVGKGTIYEHFTSKEVLFSAILEEGFQDYFRELVAAATPQQRATDKLRAVFDRHLSFISRHAAAARIIIGEWPVTRPELQEAMLGRYALLTGFVETLLREGVANGEFRPLDTAVVAQAIVGMFSSLLIYILFSVQVQEGVESQAQKLADFCLLGLASRR